MASLDLVNEALAAIGILASDGENDDVGPRFTIDSETNRQYRRSNAAGTELIVRLLPPVFGDNADAITHFQASVNDLFDYDLRDVNDSDMVGITISNDVNLLDKPIYIGPDADRESSLERLITRRTQRLQDDRENLKDLLHSYIELRSVQRWTSHRHAAYLTFAARLKFFASWPRRTELPRPESLAEAGFFMMVCTHTVLHKF